MLKSLLLLIALGVFAFVFYSSKKNTTENSAVKQTINQQDSNSIHSYSAQRLHSDEEVNLGAYKGRVMLVVNTASKCGLTPQYEDLQALHEELGDKGLAILGFPANNFMSQEPGSEEEIASFCQKNYGVDFDMFEKISVKGKDIHPIYQFLTQKEKNGVLDSKVAWNFQKYLLDKDGKLIAVFKPKVRVTDSEVRAKIDELLAE